MLLPANVLALPVTANITNPCEGYVCNPYCDGLTYYFDGHCEVVGGLPHCAYDNTYPDLQNCGTATSKTLAGIGSGTGNLILLSGFPASVFLILLAVAGAVGMLIYGIAVKVSTEG